ncbi:MAG TPA: CocE/NonD family hydrolase [Bryobacteraceae bacterium]|nr:CocE/NonD family hydrolase [Bryobacteraceae bacterium]HPQ15986.1 CocE/NonD family hydrolase [Bryobacteraceae bacterium]HPU73417.1 CocE/NonD family hydrolase [Bryobacteraceae bacterium]
MGLASLTARLVLALAACLITLHAQGLEYIKAHYTKYEFRVPMRDGKRLFTSVYVPKDGSRKYPIMFTRTPYSVAPYGVDNYRSSLGPSEAFAREGYIFVYQDVRGRVQSEGEFVHARPYLPVKRGPGDIDESTDAYDSIEWLLKRVPNHNGRVGMWGISYPGFYTVMGALDAHPALKACSPQAPIADWFIGDDWRHNGAFFLLHAFYFLTAFTNTAGWQDFDYGTPDGYDFFLRSGPLAAITSRHFNGRVPFWEELLRHDTYDEFWKSRNVLPHLERIKPAMMTVGGWFDAEDLYGALAVYESIERRNPGLHNTLVMGPWFHGGWARSDGDALGDVRFGQKTSLYYREKIELPFFNHYLNDKGELDLPEAYVFETGRNQWRRCDAWPPKEAVEKPLYLHAGGKLSFEPPAESRASFDEYISDPAKPVPFIGWQSTRMPREYMVADQRFASSRTDVLVYESEPLEEDVTIAGPLRPILYVSTTGTDSDWVVKLIDVYPGNYPDNDPQGPVRMGGYQQLVRGEPFRGRYRNSFEKPEPFKPGEVTRIEFTMPAVYHTFRSGHRIMVHIQSSWFPLVDRNPQQFVDIHRAAPADFRKATQRVYRAKPYLSSIRVNVLP